MAESIYDKLKRMDMLPLPGGGRAGAAPLAEPQAPDAPPQSGDGISSVLERLTSVLEQMQGSGPASAGSAEAVPRADVASPAGQSERTQSNSPEAKHDSGPPVELGGEPRQTDAASPEAQTESPRVRELDGERQRPEVASLTQRDPERVASPSLTGEASPVMSGESADAGGQLADVLRELVDYLRGQEQPQREGETPETPQTNTGGDTGGDADMLSLLRDIRDGIARLEQAVAEGGGMP